MKPDKQQEELSNRKSQFSKYAKFSGFAFQMIAVFVLLSLGGDWLDKRMENKFPLFTLIGVFVALISIFYTLFSFLKKDNDNNK